MYITLLHVQKQGGEKDKMSPHKQGNITVKTSLYLVGIVQVRTLGVWERETS